MCFQSIILGSSLKKRHTSNSNIGRVVRSCVVNRDNKEFVDINIIISAISDGFIRWFSNNNIEHNIMLLI